MTALQDPRSPEPEVLIEEARRRQRRRRTAVLATVAALAAGAIAYGLTAGDGPPAKPLPVAGGGSPASTVAASWHELAAPTYIQRGATVTSVIRWHGRLYAAGNLFDPGRLKGFACSVGCDPVVWTLQRGRWRPIFAWGANGGIAEDELVATNHYLLLFSGAMSTSLWRSADGLHWRRVKLPAGMAWLWQAGIASNGSRVVAAFGNRYAGGHHNPWRFPNLNPVFTSTDGIHWRQGAAVDGMGFADVTAVPGGFVATGASDAVSSTERERMAIVRSKNGLSWSVAAALPLPHGGDDALAASRHGIVLARLASYSRKDAPVKFLRSSDGHHWTAATVRGGALTNGQLKGPIPAALLAVADGFVALGNSNRHLWWSATGRVWKRIAITGAPPSAFQPSASTADGDSLLVVEVPRHAADGVPGGATTIWRLDLTPGGARGAG